MILFKTVAAELAALGLAIAVRPGEYCLSVRGGGDATAYFTDDLDDALDHGRALAAAIPAKLTPPKKAGTRPRKRRRQITAKAMRRRFIRQHNRRLRGRAQQQWRDES